MNDLESILQKIPGAAPLVSKPDGFWMIAPDLDVLELAKALKDAQAHFSTMTGSMASEKETSVNYHFFINNQAYNFKALTRENKIASISNIYPAAEWIEREIQDLYKTEFTGHPHPERLIRPTQLEPGFFREPGGAASKAKR